MDIKKDKNITIEVWTNSFYSKFIGIWRPEEEEWFEQYAPGEDPRADIERNVPHILIMSSAFTERPEVIGNNPIAPTQHPMSPFDVRRQVRHMAYMFANYYGVMKMDTIVKADLLLVKERLGFTKVKEYKLTVSPTRGTTPMTLLDLKTQLVKNYTDGQLAAVQVLTVGENFEDMEAKELQGYVHKATGDGANWDQYITITKIANVYEVDDPYLDTYARILKDPTIKYTEMEIEEDPDAMEDVDKSENGGGQLDDELNALKAIDGIGMLEGDTAAETVKEEITPDKMKIKLLEAKIKNMEEDS